jgi:hypothetical protein
LSARLIRNEIKVKKIPLRQYVSIDGIAPAFWFFQIEEKATPSIDGCQYLQQD